VTVSECGASALSGALDGWLESKGLYIFVYYLAISPLIAFTSQNTRGNPIKIHMREFINCCSLGPSPNRNPLAEGAVAVHYCQLRVSRVCACSSGVCSLAKKNP
jgi:hypothetical protein